VHPAVAWFVPAGLVVFWLVAWQHEAGLTGDNQAGLVALVGAVSVGVVLLVVLVGFAIRGRRAPHALSVLSWSRIRVLGRTD